MFRVDDSRRHAGGAVNTWPFQQPLDLLLRGAAFSAWRFTKLFRIRIGEHIAGITLKNHADLLQRFKIDS
jgi:hypothetical protein